MYFFLLLSWLPCSFWEGLDAVSSFVAPLFVFSFRDFSVISTLNLIISALTLTFEYRKYRKSLQFETSSSYAVLQARARFKRIALIVAGIIAFGVICAVWHYCCGEVDVREARLGVDEAADIQYLFGRVDKNYRVAGCAIGFDKRKNIKYIGHFKDGRYDGRSLYYWPKDDPFRRVRYEGEFQNGKRQDENGKLYWTYQKYVGAFDKGQRTGRGVLTRNPSDRMRKYNTKRDGELTYGAEVPKSVIFVDGDGMKQVDDKDIKQYDGEFLDGKFHGYGVLDYFDGAQYEGYFKNGEKEGKGAYRNSQGTTYRGTFSHGPLLTIAFTDELSRSNSEEYEGDYMIDGTKCIRCGRGVVSFARGDKYVGEFAHGKKDGLGIYYHNDRDSPELYGRVEYRLYDYRYEGKLWHYLS